MANKSSPFQLTDDVRASWNDWLAVTRERCHLNFELVGGSLDSHIAAGMQSGLATAKRIQQDIGSCKVRRVLEVGCSVGFNCFGLSVAFPDAEIIGIEPDCEAIKVGAAMAKNNGYGNISFRQGVGESLPFERDLFDLIVCHQVVEHVNDVPQVIAEMSRVLAPEGRIHLEAPNYIWPYEPHLGIWCFPLLGKQCVRLFARLQGKRAQIGYLAHLKFVHPRYLQRLFKSNELTWENRADKKLIGVLSGRNDVVVSYHRSAKVLQFFQAIGIGSKIAKLLLVLKLYPSVLYTITKRAE